MYCKKCGNAISAEMRFCKHCGEPLGDRGESAAPGGESEPQAEKTHVREEKASDKSRAAGEVRNNGNDGKKKKIIAGCIALVVIMACIVGVTTYLNNQKDAEYNAKIAEANQYLQELDYEKAETAYLDAIDIEPKRTEAYLELSDVYVAQQEFDSALDILEEGKKKTGDEKTFEQKIEEVTKQSEADPKSEQYKAYYELVTEYEERYGVASMAVDTSMGEAPEHIKMLYGLCIVQLVDFNNDGNQELLLGYESGAAEDLQYRYEIWAWHEGVLMQALEATDANHAQWPMLWVETTEDEGEILLVQDYADSTIQFLQYADGGFQTKYDVETGAYTREPKINGELVSREEIQALLDSLSRPAGDLEFETGFLNEDDRILFISFNYIDEDVARQILENTESNIAKIKE